MSAKHVIRIDVHEDKLSLKTRTDRAAVIAAATPKSTRFAAEPALQDAGAKLVKAGIDLQTEESAVRTLENEIAKARAKRESVIAEFDGSYDVYVANAEKLATSTEEVTSLGLDELTRTTYTLAPPVELTVKFDAAKGMIRARIRPAPGMRAHILELSADPVGLGTFKQLPGIGTVRAVTGQAPGTYWLRAASARGREQSEPTSPVAVLVK